MLQFFTKGKKGFTLIELLVVIAIIGLLASIVLVQLGPVRAKARDADKRQDFAQIASAMQLCYLDSACGDGEDKYISQAAMPTSIGTYLASMPTAPSGSTYTWLDNKTAPNTDNQTYCIYTTLEQARPSTYLCVSRAGVVEGTAAPTAIKTSCCK